MFLRFLHARACVFMALELNHNSVLQIQTFPCATFVIKPNRPQHSSYTDTDSLIGKQKYMKMKNDMEDSKARQVGLEPTIVWLEVRRLIH